MVELYISSGSSSSHIAQNIAERCQEYLQYFTAIEILSQHYNKFKLSKIFLKKNKYSILLERFP